MAEEGKADEQLFQLLSNLLHQVEALTNQEEVELRSKIEALGLEVTKVPSKSAQHLDELEIAKELDKLSTKLDDVDEMISSALAEDPKVQSLLSGTADVWMPVITATAEERLNFSAPTGDDCSELSESSFIILHKIIGGVDNSGAKFDYAGRYISRVPHPPHLHKFVWPNMGMHKCKQTLS